MAHDVFISYSSKDQSVADAVRAALEARAIRCWIAPRDILPGTDWGAAIVDAISASRVMVLVFSGHANTSPQIKREVERAVAKGVKLVPFRIADVPMSKHFEYFISTAHWLDAVTGPQEKHIETLCDTVRQLLQRDSTSIPSTPTRGLGASAPASAGRRDHSPAAAASPAFSTRAIAVAAALAAIIAAYFLFFRKAPPPEILAVSFPPEIQASSRDAAGSVQFRAPRRNVQRAEFEVVSAERFEPFQVVPQVAGQDAGSFPFKLHSAVPQHVTLRATLVDADGRRSTPVSFSFDVRKAAAQNRQPDRSFEISAPNGMRFKVPR
jgi:hypothetical protein